MDRERTRPEITRAVVRQAESSWCEEELSGLELADGRLRQRAIDSLQRLSEQPSASIPEASGDWAATKGTYGLFKHERVNHGILLAPHREQTVERMGAYERVLVIQDSSYLDITHYQSMEGLGPIGTENQKLSGLVMHSGLAVTEQGMSLGVVHQSVWARPEPNESLSEKERKARPIEEKESYKWLVGLSATPKLADTEVVTVCDAEADVYELLAQAVETEKGLLLRASQDRALMPPEVNRVFLTVGATQLRAQLTLKLQAKESEPAREAKVSVRYKRVKLKPPARPKREGYESLPLRPLTLWAVQVRECNPPENATTV